MGWKTGSVSSAQTKEGPPNTGDNDDYHLPPGPFDIIAHKGEWKTGINTSSAQVKEGPPNTGDNDDYHLPPGPFDIIAHKGGWKTG